MKKHSMGKYLNHIFLVTIVLIAESVIADVKISSLDDINLGIWNGLGRLQGQDTLCVDSIPIGPYRVTAVGNGPNNNFRLFSGPNQLNYRVFYNDRPRRNGRVRLRASQVLLGQNNASGSEDCPGGLNALVMVRITRNQLSRATAGFYSGVLTLTIAPD